MCFNKMFIKQWHRLCVYNCKHTTMPQRTNSYIRKDKARKIMESPIQADLKTFLSATLALSHSRIVKKHINDALDELSYKFYRLSA